MGSKETTAFTPELRKAIANYPHIESGIDFDNLLSHPKPHFLSVSGNNLDLFFKSISEINIRGLFLDSPFWIKAELIDGYLTFNLQIEREISESEVIRHPDMFGRTFIAVALTYFEQFGPVRGLEGNWEAKKDNYNQFKSAIESEMTKEAAASSTWSGKTFSELGFTQVTLVDISSNCIEAVFRRPSTSPLKASKT